MFTVASLQNSLLLPPTLSQISSALSSPSGNHHRYLYCYPSQKAGNHLQSSPIPPFSYLSPIPADSISKYISSPLPSLWSHCHYPGPGHGHGYLDGRMPCLPPLRPSAPFHMQLLGQSFKSINQIFSLSCLKCPSGHRCT